MESELQRIVRELVECLDRLPPLAASWLESAARLRGNAAAVAMMPGADAQVRDVAVLVDAAARACELAVEHTERARLAAHAFAERTVGGTGSGGAGSERAAGAGRGGDPGADTATGPQSMTIQLDLDDLEDRPEPARPVLSLSSTEPGDRDALDNPPPNATVVVDDRFTYETDDLGRVVKASATLDVVDVAHPRDRRAQRVLSEKLPGDHAGHIFARIFKGPGGMPNLVPMHGRGVNQGQYRRLENEWARAVRDHKIVDVAVDFVYEDATSRPEIIRITHVIDGRMRRRTIRNRPESGE